MGFFRRAGRMIWKLIVVFFWFSIGYIVGKT